MIHPQVHLTGTSGCVLLGGWKYGAFSLISVVVFPSVVTVSLAMVMVGMHVWRSTACRVSNSSSSTSTSHKTTTASTASSSSPSSSSQTIRNSTSGAVDAVVVLWDVEVELELALAVEDFLFLDQRRPFIRLLLRYLFFFVSIQKRHDDRVFF